MLATVEQIRLNHHQDADEYRRLWRQWVAYLTREDAIIGACLHQTEDGGWVSYVRWVSASVQQAFAGDAISNSDDKAVLHLAKIYAEMNAYISERKPEWVLEVTEDMLLPESGQTVLF